jgi:RND family efflux transporter MFP subunit
METAVSRHVRLLLLSLLLVVAAGHRSPASGQEIIELRPHRQAVTITGLTHPLKEMTVTSEVSGRCTAVLSEVGDTLGEDGRLAEIDTTFITHSLAANRIAREQTARQLAQEEKTLARYTTLGQQDAVTQAQLDEASLAADLHRIGLKNLANEEQRLKEQLARHTLTAPDGWRVIERHIEPGEVIQTGTPVARLGDFRRLRIPLAVTYPELRIISAIKNLRIALPDIGGEAAAIIYRTSPVFDPQTRKIALELAVAAEQAGHDGPLRGGMRAELRFAGEVSPSTFIVPRNALLSRYEAHWLTRPDGSRVKVLLLGSNDDGRQAVISAGNLSVGERFLASPDTSSD